MAGLDTESLFANIPLEENIKICCDSLYKNQELLCNIIKNQFEKHLRAALSNNYFLFDGSIYQQIDRVAMGSPLGPSDIWFDIYIAFSNIFNSFRFL